MHPGLVRSERNEGKRSLCQRDDASQAVPRQRIRAAARHRFETWGYRRTSIAEIARDAGIAVGTLYRYFAGQEGVFLAVVEDLNESWLTECRRALDGPGTAMERMRRLGAASIRFTAENTLITAIAMRDTDIVFAPLLERIHEDMHRQNLAIVQLQSKRAHGSRGYSSATRTPCGTSMPPIRRCSAPARRPRPSSSRSSGAIRCSSSTASGISASGA